MFNVLVSKKQKNASEESETTENALLIQSNGIFLTTCVNL